MGIAQNLINISRLKRKRLNRMAVIIDQLKPDAGAGPKIKEWKAIKDNTRRVAKINAFLSMNNFTPAELKKIKKYVFRIIIPWRLIFTLIFLAVAAFLVTQYRTFRKIPMVYAYGNNLIIYTAPDENSSTAGQMDIYGRKFANNKMENSAYAMLLTDSSGSFLTVKKNSFIQWLFNKKPDGYLKSDGVLFSKKEYREYDKFFGTIKESPCLFEIPNKIKKTFFTKVNKEYAGAILANDYPDDAGPTGFFKTLYLSLPDNSSCVLFRLIDASGTKKNLVMKITPNGQSEMLPLSYLGRPLIVPGFFSKKTLGGLTPDVHFYNTENKKTIKSVRFPYDQYQ